MLEGIPDFPFHEMKLDRLTYLAHGSFSTVFQITGVPSDIVIKIGIIPRGEPVRQNYLWNMHQLALPVLGYTDKFHLDIRQLTGVVRRGLEGKGIESGGPTATRTAPPKIIKSPNTPALMSPFHKWMQMHHNKICGGYQTSAMVMPKADPLPLHRLNDAESFLKQNVHLLGTDVIEANPRKHVMLYKNRLVLIDVATEEELDISSSSFAYAKGLMKNPPVWLKTG